jgi:t-SNARE complex subunit (syntaxin)
MDRKLKLKPWNGCVATIIIIIVIVSGIFWEALGGP